MKWMSQEDCCRFFVEGGKDGRSGYHAVPPVLPVDTLWFPEGICSLGVCSRRMGTTPGRLKYSYCQNGRQYERWGADGHTSWLVVHSLASEWQRSEGMGR